MRIAPAVFCCLVVGGLGLLRAEEELKPGAQIAANLETEIVVEGAKTKAPLHYLLFAPAGYGQEGQKWPLLLFLHGAGERGDKLDLVKKHGPPKLVEKQSDFPFVVASPQCPAGKFWSAGQLIQLVDHLIEKRRVDSARIYVTGLSMGGYGTWALAAAHPERFAACVPICGGGDVKTADRLTGMPLWVFHGAKDTAVPLKRSEEMVEAIKAAGGENARLTVYPEAGHDSWTETYNNPELYKWLLSHQRSAK